MPNPQALRTAPRGRADPPPCRTEPRCPRCGRGPAVVFRPVYLPPAGGRAARPLVCLDCCPQVPAHS